MSSVVDSIFNFIGFGGELVTVADLLILIVRVAIACGLISLIFRLPLLFSGKDRLI